MLTPVMRRTAGAVLVAGAAALVLVSCTAASDAGVAAVNLPALSVQYFTLIDCADSVVWGGQLVAPRRPDVQECWTGSPRLPFDEEAQDIMYTILAQTDAVDVSAEICPEDSFYDTAAVACRAAEDGAVRYRVVVALTQPALVLHSLPDEPTEEEIDEALSGATVEVLLATEEVSVP